MENFVCNLGLDSLAYGSLSAPAHGENQSEERGVANEGEKPIGEESQTLTSQGTLSRL